MEDSNKCIIGEIVRQVGYLPELPFECLSQPLYILSRYLSQ